MGKAARILIILTMTLAAFPLPARAQWREFIPRVYESGADLDTISLYESDYMKTGERVLKWNSVNLNQELTAYALGFIYHPRFILLNLSLSGTLRESRNESSPGESGSWRYGAGLGYGIGISVLPKHTYSLYLWASRSEHIERGPGSRLVTTSSSMGASFQYEKRPYYFHLGYGDDSWTFRDGSSDLKYFSADATYFKEYSGGRTLVLNGTYDHRDFSSDTLGIESGGSSDDISISNSISYAKLIGLRNVRLDSNLQRGSSSQESFSTGALGMSHFNWNETLAASLPLNLSANAVFNYARNSSEGSPGDSLSQASRDFRFRISHMLYSSLESAYSLSTGSSSSSGGGESSSLAHMFSAAYIKKIPGGTMVTGAGLGRSVMDNTGAATTVDEPHSGISVPGFFDLNTALTPDPLTIHVYLRSPLPPNELIALEENIHYSVTPLGGAFRITIFDLPPQFIIPGTFDFTVSYSLPPQNFRLRTDNFNYHLSLNLFDNMVHPSYGYTHSKSVILAGALSGSPLEFSSHTVSLTLQKRPFRFTGIYARSVSNINPYSKWSGELTYNQNILDTMSVNASASYEVINYLRGSSPEPQPTFTQSTFTVSASVAKWFPSKRLSLSAGGSYYESRSLSIGRGLSANTGVSWKIGRLIMAAGAVISAGQNEGASSLTTKRFHQYYYLKMKRNLF